MGELAGAIGALTGAAAALLGVWMGMRGGGQRTENRRPWPETENGSAAAEQEGVQASRNLSPEEEKELRHWLNLLSYDGTEQEDVKGD